LLRRLQSEMCVQSTRLGALAGKSASLFRLRIADIFVTLVAVILAAVALIAAASPAAATTFTTTVPNTSIVLPAYPQAGGVVIVLEGANGNVYYQFSNPSGMYQGYNNSGAGPVAWQGNPLQIAPVTTIACGLQSCTSYFGGAITRISVRFTAYDGDTKVGDFDQNKVTLGLNGTTIGNFTTTLTQTTNTAGTTLIGSSNGFGNNTYDTGWFQSTDATLAANILATGTLKSTLTDATPNDNYWDFRQGSDIVGGVPPVVAPGVTLTKSTVATNFTAVGVSIPYTYVVKNIGTVWINPLSVVDDKIASVTCGAASPAPVILPAAAGQVDPGATVNCTGTYITTQADVDAGKVTNIATASGTPQFATLGAVKDTKTVTGPTRVPGIAVTKAAGAIVDTNGNGKTDVGDTINYTFVVTNTGNVTLTNVTVTDPNAVVTGSPVASLAPLPATNTTSAITAKHVLTQTDVDSGIVTNQATASGTRVSRVRSQIFLIQQAMQAIRRQSSPFRVLLVLPLSKRQVPSPTPTATAFRMRAILWPIA
jgi:large repetitive protein